jgi:hypothetical protein
MIFQNNKSFSDPFPWNNLCSSTLCDFFLKVPRYIQVKIKYFFIRLSLLYVEFDHRLMIYFSCFLLFNRYRLIYLLGMLETRKTGTISLSHVTSFYGYL